jgi:4-amino-4-deoxy-L-arabinose transferase-like glycosyltransferase
MGLAGLLAPLSVGILLVGVHLLGWSAWRDGWRQARQISRRLSPARAAVLAFAAAILLFELFWLPLYPPTSFDSTMYHLPYAKAFAATGGVPFLASLRFPVFPQLMELLYSGMLLLADDVAAQSLQALLTLLTAGLVFLWGTEAFGRTAGWLGAAIYLGNPIVAYLAGTAYVDPSLSLFAMAALFAVWRWRRSREPSWLTLTAVFAASAAATKYLGLFFVATIGTIVLLTPAPRGRWRNALQFAAVAAAILVPWYGRILLYTGNPFFPYFPELFGPNAWEEPGRGLHVPSPLSVLTLPWDLVFRREAFNSQPPFSPTYLVALPLSLFAAIRDGRVRRMLLFTLAYVLFALSLPGESRFFLPVLPLVSVAAGAGTALLLRRTGRQVIAGAVFVLLLPGWLYVARHVRRLGALPVTAEQRNEFLAKRLPAYPAIRYLNRTSGRNYTVYAFHAENMAYFAEGRFLGDWFGPASFEKVLASGGTPEALHSKLRALGVDYLLVLEERAPDLTLDSPQFAKRFRIVYSDPHARVFALAGPQLPTRKG